MPVGQGLVAEGTLLAQGVSMLSGGPQLVAARCVYRCLASVSWLMLLAAGHTHCDNESVFWSVGITVKRLLQAM